MRDYICYYYCMKFTLRREGTIASSIPLIYWYSAFVSITEVITVAKILLNHKELKRMFTISPSHGKAAHALSPTTTIELAVSFLAIFFVLSLAVNFYLIISRSTRWVKIWFVFFMLGSIIDLVQLVIHFNLYSTFVNVISAVLNVLILWHLFSKKHEVLGSENQIEVQQLPTINYQAGKELAHPLQPTVQKGKPLKSAQTTKSKPKPKKK
jgi:hypothetical protein